MLPVDAPLSVLRHLPEEIAASPWLGRLHGVAFLGLLDYRPGVARSASRLEHSLAVASQAERTGVELGLGAAELKLLVTAAALHDVGHLPLSHSLEPLFAELHGLDHHVVGRWLIMGDGAVARCASLAPALERAGLQPEAVWALVAPGGARRSPLADLLSGPMNIDTFHGLPLAREALGLAGVSAPERPFAFHDSALWIRSDAIPDCDAFWRAKDEVYREGLNAPRFAALELGAASRSRDVAARLTPAELLRMTDGDLFERLSWEPAALIGEMAEERYCFGDGGASLGERRLRTYSIDDSVRPEGGGLSMTAACARYSVEHRVAHVVRVHGGHP